MCNKDCFNCPYPDCIRPKNADKKEYNNKYYVENKHEILRQQKERYHADLEKGRLKNRNSWDRHKDKYNARRRENRRMGKLKVR